MFKRPSVFTNEAVLAFLRLKNCLMPNTTYKVFNGKLQIKAVAIKACIVNYNYRILLTKKLIIVQL